GEVAVLRQEVEQLRAQSKGQATPALLELEEDLRLKERALELRREAALTLRQARREKEMTLLQIKEGHVGTPSSTEGPAGGQGSAKRGLLRRRRLEGPAPPAPEGSEPPPSQEAKQGRGWLGSKRR